MVFNALPSIAPLMIHSASSHQRAFARWQPATFLSVYSSLFRNRPREAHCQQHLLQASGFWPVLALVATETVPARPLKPSVIWL